MTDLIHGGGVLGEKVQGPRRALDTFDLPELTHEVDYRSDEVTSLCPITGQPDWYDVRITLENSVVGIESKSLKLYLQSFRNQGQFCEMFADKICRDVWEAITRAAAPIEGTAVFVNVDQKPRGGVSINAYARKGWPKEEEGPLSVPEEGEVISSTQ